MKIYVLIDKSGSMTNNWSETIGAVNGYVSDLSKKKSTKKSFITVSAFDSDGSMDFAVVRKNQKLKKLQKQ